MHTNQGPISMTFKHAIGDRVMTSLGDFGLIEACIYERGGHHYTISVAGGDRAYLHEDDVETCVEEPEK